VLCASKARKNAQIELWKRKTGLIGAYDEICQESYFKASSHSLTIDYRYDRLIGLPESSFEVDEKRRVGLVIRIQENIFEIGSCTEELWVFAFDDNNLNVSHTVQSSKREYHFMCQAKRYRVEAWLLVEPDSTNVLLDFNAKSLKSIEGDGFTADMMAEECQSFHDNN
jgi:hypothetical protein